MKINQNYLHKERKSSFYKTEIENSTEMTKKSANRAVEKAQIARTIGYIKKKNSKTSGKRRQEGYRSS